MNGRVIRVFLVLSSMSSSNSSGSENKQAPIEVIFPTFGNFG